MFRFPDLHYAVVARPGSHRHLSAQPVVAGGFVTFLRITAIEI